jgi:predicted Zn-dependent protease
MKFLLICVFTLVAGAQQREPGKGVNFYSIEKEIALGKQLADEFQRTVKPLDHAAIQAYCTAMGKRLAARIGGPPFSYTFTVIDGDPTVIHEAAAFPGGFVFVPVSLILAANDEDEFAGMLAHSIAHVASRDGTRMATRTELMNIQAQPLIFMGGSSGYAIQQGAALALPMGFLSFRRRMELDADRLAAEAMAAEGYDPAALARYVEREQASYDAHSNTAFSAFPRSALRVEAIREVNAALPSQEYGPHDEFPKMQETVRRLPK